MQTVHHIAQLRATVDQWRARRERVALVPTMGNLHQGHLHLVKHALRAADRVVVSIFVNPAQFGSEEDYAAYPRSLKQDSLALVEHGVHLLFVPDVNEMYPYGLEEKVRVEVPGLSEILCGVRRQGHFSGVATIITKLFNAIRPHVAIFGEKDYQQLLVVRRVVADLCLPIEIIGVSTVREADGLALSSRNVYLSAEERERAPALYRSLRWVEEQLPLRTKQDFATLEHQAVAMLTESGLHPDYVAIRRADDLALPQVADSKIIILGAAWLGDTRLIDNLIPTTKESVSAHHGL